MLDIFSATKKGDLDAVKWHIDRGLDINISSRNRKTPLHLAASRGDLEVVEYLVAKGADVNSTDSNGRTSLHSAASGGQLKVVEHLVANGANINSTDTDGQSPLHWAALRGHLKMVEYLAADGSNLESNDNDGQTPLHWAAFRGHLKVVEYLVGKGADINATAMNGLTPLHSAASGGHLEVVEYMLLKGADMNSTNTYGLTPLHSAACDGHLNIVKYMVGQGEDINSKARNGRTPLDYAAYHGHLEVVTFLISKGADINSIDTDGKTPLHSAAFKGELKVVEYLVANGAHINSEDKDTGTPLHSAASKGYLTVVEYLITNGADTDLTDKDGRTPLHDASLSGYVEVAEYLVANGANINSTDTDGQTPLHYAASEGQFKVVEYLIGKGADKDLTDADGRMPLYLAAHWNNLHVVKYLASCHINQILRCPTSVLCKLNETALQYDSVKQAFKAQGCWDESKNAISVPKVASTENSQDKPFRSSNLLPLNRSSKKSSSKLQPSHSRNEDNLVKFIVMGSHPFTISQQPEFRNLILSYDPKATFVCSSTVGRRIIRTYEAKKLELIKLLAQNTGRISFTTDLWTAPSQKVMIGVIASFVTNNWESKAIGIAFRNLKGRCSSAGITEQLQGILKEYGLDSKALAMTIDTELKNDPFAAASEKIIANGDGVSLPESHIHSLKNAINSTVQEGLKILKDITDKLVKSMSALFSSAEQLDTSPEFQSLKLLRAKLRKKTIEPHWTALMEMIEVAVEMRGVIITMAGKISESKDFMVSADDWETVTQVSRFFKPFCDVWDQTKASKDTTLYLIIPEYNRLLNYCGRIVRRKKHPQLILDAARTLRDCLISHYNGVYLICTVLDPRGKMSYFEGKDWVGIRESKVLPAIKDAWHRYKPATLDAMEQASVVSTSSTISSFCHLSTIDTHSSSKSDDMGSLSCENYDSDEEEDDDVLSRIKKRIRARDELDEYLARGPEVDEDDVLDYWKRHEEVWPNLSKMAKDYLAVPASNASERAFSAGKNLIQDKRNRLKASGIEASVCLRSWWTEDVVSSDSIVSDVTEDDDDGMLKEGEDFDVEDEY